MNKDATQEPPRSPRRLAALFGCALSLLIIGLLVILSPLSEMIFPSSSRTAEPSAVDATAPQTTAGDVRQRHATIELASVATPAPAEQLEQEARNAATDLRTDYPDVPEALHVAAIMHAQMRETQQAEDLWRKCMELDPGNERYAVNLAAVAMDRGDSELAAETLGRLVAQGSSSPDVLHHYGLSLTNLGEPEKAEKLLRQSVELYPRSASHWIVLGQAQLKQGEAADAEQSLRTALSLGAESAELFFHLATACRRQGKEEEAAEFQARFAELKAARPLEAQQRFQILSTAEARATALTILVESATVHALQGDSLMAEMLLLRAIALDPRNLNACRSLASLYERSQMLLEEQVVRRRLTEIEPFSFDNHLTLAQVSSQLGQTEKAEASLKLALSLQPAAAVGYVALAEFYNEIGATSKARWFAQEAVRRHPSAEGYEFLAETCRRAGDEAGARKALEAANRFKQGR